MSKYQRTKGHSFERKTAILFQSLGFKDAKRHLEFQTSEADEGRDLDNTGFFNVQCKVGAQVPVKIYQALEQIKDSKGKHRLAVMKRDGKQPIVAMEWDTFAELTRSMILEGIIKV